VDFAGDKVKAGLAGDSTAASAGLDRQVGWGRCGFFFIGSAPCWNTARAAAAATGRSETLGPAHTYNKAH
jgi:hypothetical protein